MRGCSSARRSVSRCCSPSRTARRTTARCSFRASHTLTPDEKEDRYGIAATRQAGGNVRYAGGIGAEFREPLSLNAGEMILFHPGLLHASSGFVNGRDRPSRERMSITLRVTVSGAELRDEALSEEHEERDLVLRTIRRLPGRIE